MPNVISNADNCIDSRDVIERIAELVSNLETEYEEYPANQSFDERNQLGFDSWLGQVREDSAHTYQEEAQELHQLKELESDAEGCADWEHGAQLIRESYFQEFAEELAEDVGAISKDQSWPNNCIDWERAARELSFDYSPVVFDGVTYLVRS